MYICRADISMRDKAEACGSHAACADTMLLKARHRIDASHSCAADIEVHNIGLGPRVEADAGDVLQDTRKCLCISMVCPTKVTGR